MERLINLNNVQEIQYYSENELGKNTKLSITIKTLSGHNIYLEFKNSEDAERAYFQINETINRLPNSLFFKIDQTDEYCEGIILL